MTTGLETEAKGLARKTTDKLPEVRFLDSVPRHLPLLTAADAANPVE